MSRSSLAGATFVACLCLVTMPAAAGALPGRSVSAKPSRMVKRVAYSGVQHLHYEFGPIQILPGQNNIDARVDQLKPKVPGFITRFKPNLVYSGSHKVPRVDVIHLHHGVWLMKGYPTFAAGEEKTTFQLPAGLRLPLRPERHVDPQLHDPQPLRRTRPRSRSPTTSTSCPTARPRRSR